MPAPYVASLVKISWKNLSQHRFHRKHAREAREVLRSIESRQGRTNAGQLRLADAYARDVLGDACYAPWLHVYTALNGHFKEGWIPDNYYGWIVVPKMKGLYGQMSHLKPVSRLLFQDDAFPDLGYYVNGIFYTADHIAIHKSQVANFVFSTTDRIAFKLDHSMQGKGVFLMDRKDFDAERISQLGNGVLQRFIVQHATFDQFASKAVATVRLTTVVDDAGAISLRACFLRLGRSADTYIRPDSEVCVPVHLESGRLFSTGYLSDWTRVDAHPDSKIRFDGVTLPAFAKCVEKVMALHAKAPFARCVGWDLTVDIDENVLVMEWNAEHNDVKFSEATQGPCFTDLKWETLRPMA
ncbi:sugar-transfer associated ATP-grasp domain-containing protein [Caballeronia sp. AZ10_KS36]|uniref:sugar-transfer associated ATP-grasp domain-containing protein n=1 Tax=Caballeronia sp. AZ10_KS36 TaxID=2921757 RepID=UPI002029460A|nr:sugar-transfer associated ATP-grasp domain-containing protein [Caballeronia sp. AZ10_KS36]